jgi:hypothetical protein
VLSARRLIHGLVHVHGDMEAIQHMQRLSRLGSKHVQIGLPHVATDEAQPLDQIWSQFLQAPPQRLLRASLAYHYWRDALASSLAREIEGKER